MSLSFHQIGIIDDTFFRCVICGKVWLFNPLMFQDSVNPEIQMVAICPGPKWVQQNYVSRTMWQQDVRWQ